MPFERCCRFKCYHGAFGYLYTLAGLGIAAVAGGASLGFKGAEPLNLHFFGCYGFCNGSNGCIECLCCGFEGGVFPQFVTNGVDELSLVHSRE